MSNSTLMINKNIISAKRLVGIANFIKRNSEARFLSRGTQVLTVEQEIRNTKRAQVLMPLLVGIQDVKEILQQAKAGFIPSTEMELNEFIVELANEKITKPLIYRPRDGEVISASSIMSRYQASFEITATIAKDIAYYQNIIAQGKAGIEIAVGGTLMRSEIVDATLTETTIKDKAFEFANKIRTARQRIKKHKDKLLQTKISNKDIAIIVNADGETLLGNDARYNMYSEAAVKANGALDLEIDGAFDKSPVLVSKQLPAGVDFIVMMFGAATSIFSLRKKLNMDKIAMVEAYGTTMEFDEGTGVWLPHMITIGSSNLTALPPQAANGFDDYILSMNVSKTESGNKNGSAGIGSITTPASTTPAATEPNDEPNDEVDNEVIEAAIEKTKAAAKVEMAAAVKAAVKEANAAAAVKAKAAAEVNANNFKAFKEKNSKKNK